MVHTLYQCKHCGTQGASKRGMEEHEEHCEKTKIRKYAIPKFIQELEWG